MSTERVLVLVDGEHFPPVVADAIGAVAASRPDATIAGVALLGGHEKLGVGTDVEQAYGYGPVVTGASPIEAFRAALDATQARTVVDLSDEPVLDARTRLHLVALALARNIRYEGADFVFDAPRRPKLATKPSLAVIGTSKRSGKTAIGGATARIITDAGRPTVIVAMGRGGPAEPEVIDPTMATLTPEALLARADAGQHAASDHLEDALAAGVPTIGTRRCGGGLAGTPARSTFALGVELANARPEEFLVFEGSGTAIPPVAADVTLCVVPATADPELVTGYLGPLPLLLSDGIVLTLVSEPLADSGAVGFLERRIRQLVPGVPVVHTTFRPRPLGPVSGETAIFATTAHEAVAAGLAAHLESEYGVTVVSHSSNLAHRTRLGEDLAAAPPATVLITELKAAAVDLATRFALERGMRVVYSDNRVVAAGGDTGFDDFVRSMADRAVDRFRQRS